MIDVQKAAADLGGLGLLKFFPGEKHAQAALVALVCDMATTNEQIEWLVKRCRNLWNQWEGPHELRAVFCSKFKPADGVEAYSALERFAGGIPSEKESTLALPASSQRQIAPAGPVSAAPSVAGTVRDLCAATNLNGELKRNRPVVREIPERQVKPGDAITQADIDRAVKELRDRRAAAELEMV